ncbi:MAG TPA: LysR family transcriptional regulator [Aliiroseovarius sp.]|nr:LysR family transcriptional regulator [Aliiroseovarius sp.]
MRPSQNHHRALVAFALILREGSVSRAAAALGVTQSAVTQQIARLERQVGEKLLRHGRDGPELTTAGRRFHELADRLLTLDQAISERLEQQRDLMAGQLTLMANAPLPALRLIGEFSRAWPQIHVDFALKDWTTAMAHLRERRIDIGIITNPDLSGDWQTHVLERPRYVAYLRRDDALAGAATLSLAQIAERRLLLPERGSLTRRTVCARLSEMGLSPAHSMTTAGFPLMKEAVLQGIGVGVFLEDSTVSTEGLIMKPIADLPERFETCLVVPRDRAALRLVDTFVQMAISGTSDLENLG